MKRCLWLVAMKSCESCSSAVETVLSRVAMFSKNLTDGKERTILKIKSSQVDVCNDRCGVPKKT